MHLSWTRSVRFVPVLLVATGGLARASHVGGPFSGPTSVSGGTAYWNAAAAAASPDPLAAMIDFGVSPIQVSYHRADDMVTQRTFEKQEFSTVLPEPLFTLSAPTPWRGLRLQAGGYPLAGAGARWSDDGPQRYFSSDSSIYAYAVQGGVVASWNENFAVALAALVSYNHVDLNSSIDFGAFANNVLGSEVFPYEDPLLEGRTRTTASGWSGGAAFGVWGRPISAVQLGASLLLPKDAHMVGETRIDAAESLLRTMPGFDEDPVGRVEIEYPLPWELHVGGSVESDATLLAGHLWYSRRRVQQVILASVSDANQELIEGRQVSAKGVHDDWELAARLEQRVTDAWRVAVLIDYDPRYVPTESITPINLDFTRYEIDVGMRYRVSRHVHVALTGGYVYLTPVHVTNSLYNPRASGDSGLSLPSANGEYEGRAFKLGLGVELHWPTAR